MTFALKFKSLNSRNNLKRFKRNIESEEIKEQTIPKYKFKPSELPTVQTQTDSYNRKLRQIEFKLILAVGTSDGKKLNMLRLSEFPTMQTNI
ncbi:hypothetical protein [Chryseobacterium sp. MMS23-Vi53]|uniref:hypothetical protein n=1 Tax=Chryseobacterium sp. MMS23-Vi53 TaxID=3386644 RepID=UPI0039ED6909